MCLSFLVIADILMKNTLVKFLRPYNKSSMPLKKYCFHRSQNMIFDFVEQAWWKHTVILK